MNKFNALTLLGWDGPDSTSPPSEIMAEIERLSKPENPHPVVTSRIKSLQALLKRDVIDLIFGKNTSHP